MKFTIANETAKHYLSCVYNNQIEIKDVLDSINLIPIYLYTNILNESQYIEVSSNANKLSNLMYESIEDTEFTLVELILATSMLNRAIIKLTK